MVKWWELTRFVKYSNVIGGHVYEWNFSTPKGGVF
jgi:hypothetical protein